MKPMYPAKIDPALSAGGGILELAFFVMEIWGPEFEP